MARLVLTAAGRKIARRLTLRHHLIERMLTEMFGMEWYKVHDEAERLEHAVSPDFEAKLLARLGRGSVSSRNLSELESPDSRRRRGLLLLSERAGKRYRVSGIYERDRHLLQFLEARGIRPGQNSVWPSVTTIKPSRYGHPLAPCLGRPAAEKILGFNLSSRSV